MQQLGGHRQHTATSMTRLAFAECMGHAPVQGSFSQRELKISIGTFTEANIRIHVSKGAYVWDCLVGNGMHRCMEERVVCLSNVMLPLVYHCFSSCVYLFDLRFDLMQLHQLLTACM